MKKLSAFGLGPFSQLRMESSSGFILYRNNYDIFVDFKLKKTFRLLVYKDVFQRFEAYTYINRLLSSSEVSFQIHVIDLKPTDSDRNLGVMFAGCPN